MNPRRILFCTLGYEPSPVGGAERQARMQAEELARRGHRVEIVSPRWRGTRSQRVGDVVVHRLPCIDRRPFRTASYLPMLLAWLLVHLVRFDLVHVHLANLQADVVGVARLIRRRPAYVKVAAGGRTGEVARMRPVSRVTRYIGLRSADRVQAISSEIRRDLLSIGIEQQRIVRIPNGLRTSVYRPASPGEKTELRRKLDLPQEAVLVLFAGRFARYKGILDLLAAWPRVDATTEAWLVVVGEQAIDAPVGPLPHVPGTIVRPWTPDVVDYFRAVDVYVHPSHADGMPNVVLEAMGCGAAVVATRVAAVPEMIEDRVTGRLVDIGAIDELASSIGEVITDVDLRTTLGANAASHVAATYAIERVVDLIEGEYQAIFGGAG